MAQNQSQLLTHTLAEEWESGFHEIKKRLLKQGDLPHLPLKKALSLLDQLTAFELGCSLIKNRGLNGYWTSYVVLFPHTQRSNTLSPLEEWVLTRCPVVKATQERFDIFQKVLQAQLKPQMTLASIPCGFMDVLLGLDYKNTPDVTLTGIDYDLSAITQAQENAKAYDLEAQCHFLQRDAWDLRIQEGHDLIVSNGLNFYESDDNRVILLYKEFYKALKPKGQLVISFLTPPPALSPSSPWRNIDPEDGILQKLLLSDILQIKWQVFRTEAVMQSHLEEAGFKLLSITNDSQGMMPTILAQKG